MKTTADMKEDLVAIAIEDLVAIALAWDGARGVSLEMKRRRNALECPGQSPGDYVTPGTQSCWRKLLFESDMCDTCKANRKAHIEYLMAKKRERSLAAKMKRRVNRVRVALIGSWS